MKKKSSVYGGSQYTNTGLGGGGGKDSANFDIISSRPGSIFNGGGLGGLLPTTQGDIHDDEIPEEDLAEDPNQLSRFEEYQES